MRPEGSGIERYINRSSDNEIKERWESKNGVTFTEKADMDIDSFKEAVDGVDDWFVNELKSQGYEDGQEESGRSCLPNNPYGYKTP